MFYGEEHELDTMYVTRMAGGDQRAASRLYDRHNAALLRVAFAIVKDADDAEEVVSDAFAKAWADATRFDQARGTVIAWLTMLVRSRALDVLRARLRRERAHERAGVASSIDLAHDGTGDVALVPGYDGAAGVDRWSSVTHALQQLPQEQRDVIERAYLQSASHARVAEQLGVPLGTVKTRARLGLRKMRAALDYSA